MYVNINDDVRTVYNQVKDSLMSKGYGLKVAMLETKKRILEIEASARSKKPLESEGFWGQLFEAISSGINNTVQLSELENQLNALIVEDLAYL